MLTAEHASFAILHRDSLTCNDLLGSSYSTESDMGTDIHPHPRPASQILSTSPRDLSLFPQQLFSCLFYSMTAKLRPCFVQTATSILLNSRRQCRCHTFTVHLLSTWTNSNRSSTASALSCLTVTAVGPITVRNVPVPAVLPHTRYPLPWQYRIFV